MPRQARSVAKTRIALEQQINREEPKEHAPTIEEVAVSLKDYVQAAVDTLGNAAANGDVQAAKTILDFVRAADTEEQGSKGKAMLDRIAAIRGNRGPAT